MMPGKRVFLPESNPQPSGRLDRFPIACRVRIVRGCLKVTAQAHGTTENTEHTEASH